MPKKPNANYPGFKNGNIQYFRDIHIALEWGKDGSKPKYPPGNGWRKLTQECIRRLVVSGELPAEHELAKWAEGERDAKRS